MRLKAALVLMFFGNVSCLPVLYDCKPKNRLETYIKGKEMKLRVWVPEIGDATFLTLISENDRTGIIRKIEIRKNFATVQTKDEETVSPERKLPIQNNSLPHGWVNFMVTSKENFTVTVPDVNLTLIDVQDDVQDKNVIIRGSNVTLNCILPTLQWEVSARQEAFIPLSPNASHDFSLFSRAPFTPLLAVGSGGEEPFGFPSPSRVFELSPLLVYYFKLDCAINEKQSSCYIQGAGVPKVFLGSFPREATSLSLIATGMDNYIIVQNITEGPDQEGGRTKRLESVDQNEEDPYIIASTAIFLLTVFLVVLVLISTKAGDFKVFLGSFPREATSLSLKASGMDDYSIAQGIRKEQKEEPSVENCVDDLTTESTKLSSTCT